MSRVLAAFDRLGTLVLGLLLTVGGLVMLLGYLGVKIAGHGWDHGVDTSRVGRMTGQPWYLWAIGVAGVLLVLIGLRWALAHIPARTPTGAQLAGSDDTGRLGTSLATIGDAAADRIATIDGVARSHAAVMRVRGQKLIELRVVVDAGVRLDRVQAVIDDVCTDLARMLGADTPPTRVRLDVNRSTGTAARVN